MLREALPEIVTGSVPGPKAAELLKRRDAAIPKSMCGTTYPICMGRGEGAMLEDVDGNRFLDWIGGVGVLNIGYSNPEVVEAVKAQAEKYFHGIFNVYVHEGYVKLAEMFDETMPCRGDKMKTILETPEPGQMKMRSRLQKPIPEEIISSVSPVHSTEEPT